MKLEPSARLAEARKVLDATQVPASALIPEAVEADRALLRAALEQMVDYAEDMVRIVAEAHTEIDRLRSSCKCGFRAPELGPHPACPIHGDLSSSGGAS